MTDEELRISAIGFAKSNKEKIAKKLTDKTIYLPDETPISVFMAGSPGAGKTEYSRNLINILEGGKRRVIRIDGDDIRLMIPGYTGNNSHLFQGAISLVVEKIHDFVLHNNQTFVLDGTLSKYDKAVKNIERSLGKKRSVYIFYTYQKPDIAWKFTEAREKAEGRNIPKDIFIEQFFSARETVEQIRTTFGEEVVIYLVKKDFVQNTVEYVVQIEQNGMQIDDYILESYNREDLKKVL